MKSYHYKPSLKKSGFSLVKILPFTIWLIISNTSLAQQTSKPALPVGTTKIWGKVAGITIEGLVQGPSTSVTPLQVACVFEYTEGDIYTSPPALPANLNGMVHLDHDLKGLITDIRKSGKFKGHEFETILITPPKGTIAAEKLLLIGLGNRDHFNPGIMTDIGAVALREALKLNVTSFSFASDLKDGGIDSPTAEVASNVTKGIIQAYQTQEYLKSKQMSVYKSLTQVMLLAGPAYFISAGQGIQEAISTFKN